jgi:FkbM family methyltransferase
MKRHLKTFSFFSPAELLLIFAGKMLRPLRSAYFDRLWRKKNILDFLYVNNVRVDKRLGGTVATYPVNGRPTSCYVRLEGSDAFVLKQIWVDKEYDAVIDVYKNSFNEHPKTLIDAGANIGLTSLYFHAFFPGIQIIAIEPELANAAQVEKNAELNGAQSNIRLVAKALWARVTTLAPVSDDFRDGLDWSFAATESVLGTIETVTPESVIKMSDGSIDIFKIDIEGAEAELFADNVSLEWVRSVKVLAIEVHPEKISLDRVQASLSAKGFSTHTSGELLIAVNNHLVSR